MPKKDKPEGSAEEPSALVSAAKKIGKAAGKVVSLVTPSEDHAPVASIPAAKPGRFQKKNKSRLPRREKKARQKAA